MLLGCEVPLCIFIGEWGELRNHFLTHHPDLYPDVRNAKLEVADG